MTRNRTALALLLLNALALSALHAQSEPASPPLPPGTQVLRTGTRLVVLDVIVQDSSGRPVHNLPRSAFQVTENKAPQNPSSFEEYSAATPPPVPADRQLPKMPPGTFTDYTPVPGTGPLNVILIDALNTPMQDQSYLRSQLQQYVNKAQPGANTAIFGLNTQLYILQGFTADLQTLKDAVNHKLTPRSSTLLDDPLSGTDSTNMSDIATESGMTDLAANLQQFEAVQQSYQLQLRAQYTLDAFNNLAHYLASFPGRKNVIWFSGSFPIDIYPDATLDDPFSVLNLNREEFRETTNLLTRANVAVYPVDARGLQTQPAFNASNSGRQYARNPQAFGKDIMKFNNSQAMEHATMDQMAGDTGGRAFYNTNGLAAATAAAIDSGSNYYTLAYTPTDRNPHGEYRAIHVSIVGPQAAAGLKLYYRRGYYADDPRHPGSTVVSALTTQAPGASAAYSHAAMFRGAPTPEDILFKVRVLPATGQPEATIAPGNQLDATAPIKGPFLRYAIDYAAVPSDFRFTQQSNGAYADSIEFTTFVYDANGKLLNANGRTVQLNLPAASYKKFLASGIGLRLEVSAPAKGESFLRIGIHDIPSNRYGVVEVPTSSVRNLPPAPPPNTPAPSAAPSAAPAPSSPTAPSTAPTQPPSPATPSAAPSPTTPSATPAQPPSPTATTPPAQPH